MCGFGTLDIMTEKTSSRFLLKHSFAIEYLVRVNVGVCSVLYLFGKVSLKSCQKPQLVKGTGYYIIGCSGLFSFPCQSFFFKKKQNKKPLLFLTVYNQEAGGQQCFVNLQQIFK